jgi:hypothetical protein
MSKAVSENIRYRRAGAHAHPVALQPEPVAVVFHFVEPVGAGRDSVADRGEAEVELGMKSNIGIHSAPRIATNEAALG